MLGTPCLAIGQGRAEAQEEVDAKIKNPAKPNVRKPSRVIGTQNVSQRFLESPNPNNKDLWTPAQEPYFQRCPGQMLLCVGLEP